MVTESSVSVTKIYKTVFEPATPCTWIFVGLSDDSSDWFLTLEHLISKFHPHPTDLFK